MTRADLVREIGELAARGVRIQSDIAGWLNKGQRIIAQRANWTFLHDIQSVTVTSGAVSANLPTNWKELGPEKSPITYTDPTNSQFPRPVIVKSRAELEAMSPGFYGYVTNAPSGYGSPVYVFLEQNAGGRWTINLPTGFPILTDITYRLSCYLFPADLSLGTDHNGLTDDGELSEALINWVKCKAIGIVDLTDPQVALAEQAYEKAVRRALGQDARRRIAGRSLHM